MTREVTEDEAALLDALAAEKPARALAARLQAKVADLEAQLNKARAELGGALNAGGEFGHIYQGILGDHAVLEAIRKIRSEP